jgi:hypothetical protein
MKTNIDTKEINMKTIVKVAGFAPLKGQTVESRLLQLKEEMKAGWSAEDLSKYVKGVQALAAEAKATNFWTKPSMAESQAEELGDGRGFPRPPAIR